MNFQKLCARSLIGLLAIVGASFADASQTSYEKRIESWREKQEANLKSDDGWLTVVGLFWLKEGANSFGTDPSSDILLPPGSAPNRAGTFEFHDGKTTMRATNGVTIKSKGEPVTVIEMRSDQEPPPDIIEIGNLAMHIIKRGVRYGVRLKDRNSKQRREFTGLRWFPVKESYRITAKFVRYDQPKNIPIPNILGDVTDTPSPGYVVFERDGKKHRLEPVMSGEDKLFFIFGDLTNGKTTYPAGRFLYTDLPKDGQVALDFNEAVNPPCAFTDFATCPLPPPQNRLKIAVEAGELSYHAKGH